MQSLTEDSLSFESTFLAAFYFHLSCFVTHTLLLAPPPHFSPPGECILRRHFPLSAACGRCWIFRLSGQKRRVCSSIASDSCEDVDNEMYKCFFSNWKLFYNTVLSKCRPTFHGMELGMMFTSCILLSELAEVPLCQATWTKYYRQVVDFYTYKMHLLHLSV